MRRRATTNGLTLQATAGAYVVMLGMNMSKAACKGFKGFAIHRTDHESEEATWMSGLKTFEVTDPGLGPGAKYSTRDFPIQGFTWSDFAAKPGRRYTYRVLALRGAPEALEPFKEVALTVTTESEEGGNHDIFFNRGAAASQEFARRFGNVRPDEAAADDPRWKWLSRGASEAIDAFVNRAKDDGWGLRVAAYEFRLSQFAEALRAAKKRGVDVRITYDACANPPDKSGHVFPRDDNRSTAEAAKIKGLCTERVTRADVAKPPISHHKFIVLLKGDKPQAVLTGSTNFSLGGVFGQSNVVHVVEDEDIAAQYLECWKLLKANTPHDKLRERLSDVNRIPSALPAKGTNTIFSPQENKDALEFYARLAQGAAHGLFMTFAFGINKVFLDVYENGQAKLRYALLDKLLGPGVKKEQRPAAEKAMRVLRAKKENRFAVGNRITTNAFDRWLSESLTGLNTHVQFIHTKFLLIDPLSEDPIVVTGSANFSDASTLQNDENMLIIRGNKRVADIYLGEYMRLWNHYAFREFLNRKEKPANGKEKPTDVRFKFLRTDDWWKEYFGDTDRSRQRQYFSCSFDEAPFA
jgi:phosphatidylserine/phosphatidylglycerophosphate/cardiolipin synthase-like enzyme